VATAVPYFVLQRIVVLRIGKWGEIRWSDRDSGRDDFIAAVALNNSNSSFLGSKPFRPVLPDVGNVLATSNKQGHTNNPVMRTRTVRKWLRAIMGGCGKIRLPWLPESSISYGWTSEQGADFTLCRFALN
jgi:hypothetical protein